MMNRVLLVLVSTLICSGSGCGPSKAQRDCEKIVTSLEEQVQQRIASKESLDKSDLSPDELRRQKEFWALAIASDQSIIALLKEQGSEAYRQPLIELGEITPRPPNAKRTMSFRFLLYVEWLEQKCEMTGFFFELEDGTIYEFKDTIETSDDECDQFVRSGPARHGLIPFALDTDPPTEKSVIRLSPEQYAEVFEERKVRRIGLISKDGVKSKAGVIGYSAQFVGVLTDMAPRSEKE